MDRLQFFLDLVDKMSGPATRIAKAMRGTEAAIKAVDKADSQAGSGNRLTRMFRSLGSGISGASKKLEAFGESKSWGAVTSFAGGLWGVAKAATAAAAVSIGVGIAGGQYAIEAASFKRNMVASFELMLGSKEEAARVYKMIDDFADSTPFEARDVFATFKSLKGSGLNVDDAKRTMAGIFDIASLVDPSRQKNAIDSITLGIAKIQGEGKLTGEAFNMITEATDGFAGKGIVLEELAKALKVTKDQASSMISKGLVPAKTAVDAYLAAISKGTGQSGGALGGAMAKFGSGSFEGQVSTLKSRMSSLFEDINIQPLIDGLTLVNDMLKAGSPAGDALRASINALGADAGNWIKATFTPENIKRFISAIDQLVKSFGAFNGGMFEGFSDALKPLASVIGDISGNGNGMADTFRVLGKVLGVTLAIFAYVGVVLAAVGMAIYAVGYGAVFLVDQIARLIAYLVNGNVWEDLKNFGLNIVNGLWDGIKAGFVWLKDGWNEMISFLPDSVKAKLQIKSPSRLMKKLGVFTAEGFALGLESQAANTNAAMGAVVQPPAAQAPVAIASTSSGAPSTAAARAPISISISVGTTAAPGVTEADARAHGEAVAAGMRGPLTDLFEQLAREAA